jgi:hypothetical protein
MNTTKIKTNDRVLSISVPDGGSPTIKISASEHAWVELTDDHCTFYAHHKPIRFSAPEGMITMDKDVKLN